MISGVYQEINSGAATYSSLSDYNNDNADDLNRIAKTAIVGFKVIGAIEITLGALNLALLGITGISSVSTGGAVFTVAVAVGCIVCGIDFIKASQKLKNLVEESKNNKTDIISHLARKAGMDVKRLLENENDVSDLKYKRQFFQKTFAYILEDTILLKHISKLGFTLYNKIKD